MIHRFAPRLTALAAGALVALTLPATAFADRYAVDDTDASGQQHVQELSVAPGADVTVRGRITLTRSGNKHVDPGERLVFAVDKVQNAPPRFHADDVVLTVPATWSTSGATASAPYVVTFTAPTAASDAAIVVKWAVKDDADNPLTGGDGLVIKLNVLAPVDTTPPVTTASFDPAPNAAGWAHGPVTVTLAATDDRAGTPTITYSVDGTAQSYGGPFVVTGDGVHALTFHATDAAGNAEAEQRADVKVDATRPSVSASATGQRGDGGWYVGPVTVSFACADATSGVASCPADVQLGEGAGQSAGGTASDRAGNSAQTGVAGINVDLTAPTIKARRSPEANGAGWANADVIVSFDCADALSGVATCAAPVTVSTEAENQSASGAASDRAGNRASTTLGGISIDKRPPTTVVTLDGATGANDWYVGPVTATVTASDSLSGVADTSYSIDGGTTWLPYREALRFAAGGRYDLRVRSSDRAGNLETPRALSFKIDATAPTIAGARGSAPNAAGWYNADVTVRFTCADNLSGVASCAAPVTISRDGRDQSAAGTVADAAGNGATTTVGGINLDKTPPAIAFLGNQGTYTVDQTVAILCFASDALSGVASTSCVDTNAPAYSFPLGSNGLTAVAADRAGSSASSSTSFTVKVTYDSLCALTQRFVDKSGIASSLCSKLTSAANAKARGSTSALSGLMGAYVNEVQAQTGKSITAANAAILIRLAGSL